MNEKNASTAAELLPLHWYNCATGPASSCLIAPIRQTDTVVRLLGARVSDPVHQWEAVHEDGTPTTCTPLELGRPGIGGLRGPVCDRPPMTLEDLQALRAKWAQYQHKREADCSAHAADLAAAIARGREWFAANVPAGASSAIVAELEADDCELESDYFATHTEKMIVIGFSKHDRDLFPEMRKAAAASGMSELAHLGPGCDVWTPRVVFAETIQTPREYNAEGWGSHWHNELTTDGDGRPLTFTTEADARAHIAKAGEPGPIGFDGQEGRFRWDLNCESIEHREKYSMGHGYYLKGSGRYSSGWIIRKTNIGDEVLAALGRGEYRLPNLGTQAPAPVQTSEDKPAPAAADPTGASISHNADKEGIEIRFPAKPSSQILDALKAAGWRWSRFGGCWYKRNAPGVEAEARGIVGKGGAL